MVDVTKEIRMAIDTGKVQFGSDKAEVAARLGKAKLIILAANGPKDKQLGIKKLAKLSGMPVFVYPGTSIELGAVCGKPFSVAALAVLEEGTANLVAAVAKGNETPAQG